MRRIREPVPTLLLLGWSILLTIPAQAQAQEPATPGLQARPYGAFAFQDSVSVPLDAVGAFDRFVDVNAWWDHRFSESPVRFAIDPRPGGGFLEIFDESGDGVLHATVLFVKRGELLRMEGPLGLSGFALHMVHTLTFRPQGGSTLVHLDVRGSGELEEAWPRAIRSVWHHFLWERFKPFAEGKLGEPGQSP